MIKKQVTYIQADDSDGHIIYRVLLQMGDHADLSLKKDYDV